MHREPVQTTSDPGGLDDLLGLIEQSAGRVAQTAIERRGSAEPAALYREGAVAILRAMPPLLGPANAMLPHQRHLHALADALGVADPARFDGELPWNDLLTPRVLAGSYELRWEPDSTWHQHGLRLEQAPGGGLRGVALIDRGLGPQSRLPSPDDAAHLVAFLPDPSEPHELRFSVRVGTLRPVLFAFDLTWSLLAAPGVRSADWDLLGHVAIDGDRRPASARWVPSVAGADDGRAVWPSWEQLRDLAPR